MGEEVARSIGAQKCKIVPERTPPITRTRPTPLSQSRHPILYSQVCGGWARALPTPPYAPTSVTLERKKKKRNARSSPLLDSSSDASRSVRTARADRPLSRPLLPLVLPPRAI